ncbi:MAG: zinc ribbon domain-containing protein [Candidatus Nanopelagicales bacterium]|nr:zinc ribbon domain-containing protein [Candidatus Nanopelagicales bacterium]
MGNEQLLLRGLMVCHGCNKRMMREGINGRDSYGCSGRNLSTCTSPAVISANKIENFDIAQLSRCLIYLRPHLRWNPTRSLCRAACSFALKWETLPAP